MDIVEVFKKLNALTNHCTISCMDCWIGQTIAGKEISCSTFMREDPEQVQAIIAEWEASWNTLTRGCDLERRYPNVIKYPADDIIAIKPCMLDRHFKCLDDKSCKICCEQYWNRPLHRPSSDSMCAEEQ